MRSQGYAFQVELTYRAVRAGFEMVEVPTTFRDRQRGQSKMSWRIAAEAARLVPLLRLGPTTVAAGGELARDPVAPEERKPAV